MHISETHDRDLDAILQVEREAFGRDDEAELVRRLLVDPSAQPVLSLLARSNELALGHVLFTRVRVSDTSTRASILAPLAVVPAVQNQRVGTALVRAGLKRLVASGIDLVFVLGHPRYYARFGFGPATSLGLEAPFPIPSKHADAWMVQAIKPGVIGAIRGRVICADVLNKREYWVE